MEISDKVVGKVRDIYDIGYSKLLIRHSDRVSSFDKVWCNIPGKGKILNLTSGWWFDRTQHIIKNHLIRCEGNDMIVRKCKVFPVEIVVRGYITGSTKTSLWTVYSKGDRRYCGVDFPDGLKRNQKLEKPVITPTTKSESDEPISFEGIVERGLVNVKDLVFIYEKARELFNYGQRLASSVGLILVDTKYEFGRDVETGEILLIDEIHTCDSSRYWKASSYQERFNAQLEPDRFDKDVIRRWIKENCDPYVTLPASLNIPDNVKELVLRAYTDFFEILTETKLSDEMYKDFEVVVFPTTPTTRVCDYFDNYHTNRVEVICGSKSDAPFVIELMGKLEDEGVYCSNDWTVLSAHKQTRELLEYLTKVEENKRKKGWKVVYVTVAGRSNALSGVVACNTNSPVYACPPFKDKIDMMVNVQSTLQTPSNAPVALVLDPGNLAKLIKRHFQ